LLLLLNNTLSYTGLMMVLIYTWKFCITQIQYYYKYPNRCQKGHIAEVHEYL
jgi:hypothetical protein